MSDVFSRGIVGYPIAQHVIAPAALEWVNTAAPRLGNVPGCLANFDSGNQFLSEERLRALDIPGLVRLTGKLDAPGNNVLTETGFALMHNNALS